MAFMACTLFIDLHLNLPLSWHRILHHPAPVNYLKKKTYPCFDVGKIFDAIIL